MHSTPHHPLPFDPHSNQNEPEPIHSPSRLFRFSYKLQFYNTLQTFYRPTRQALTQQPVGAARDQPSLVCTSRMSASPTKSSFHTKLHHPPTNSLLFNAQFKPKGSQDVEQLHLSRERDQRMGWQNGRQMKQEAKIGWRRDQFQMFPEIYEEVNEESDSYQIRDKLQSNSNSASNIQQQPIQNMQQNYQVQSVTPLRPQPKNTYNHSPRTPPRRSLNHNTPLFISERNNDSEMSCNQKKSYQRRNIISRYQSPDDMNESQSQVQQYLQLMQQQIKATLYGQNIEAFIKSWTARNNSPHPHQRTYLLHSTAAQKEPIQTQKEQPREERDSQMQLIKQTEPMENESNIIQPVLQGGESEEYRMPNLEAILNYNAPEFCFRDNQEEQQLFQLNQFLLN